MILLAVILLLLIVPVNSDNFTVFTSVLPHCDRFEHCGVDLNIILLLTNVSDHQSTVKVGIAYQCQSNCFDDDDDNLFMDRSIRPLKGNF